LNSLQAQRASDHFDGELLVSFANGVEPKNVVERLQTFENIPTQLKVIKKIADPMNIWLLSYDFKNIDEDEMLYLLRMQKEVSVAQFNHELFSRAKVPNDTFFTKQWQWDNTGQTGGKADADVDAPEAWDITTGGLTTKGDEIVVAVIDDGTDFTHPDLMDNLWINKNEIPNNGIDDDGNGYIDDVRGWNPVNGNDNVGNGSHGVNVNGMIGAKGNNKTGVTGINWKIKIMNISPIPNLSSEAAVISAYAYAYNMRKIYNKSKGAKGAFVVATNSSWGIDKGKPANSPIWCAFYDTLGTVGILNVAATTNNSSIDVDKDLDLPTACPSDFMLAVQMTDASDVNKSGFGQVQIDVAAPGSNIYTTSFGGKYTNTSGTSFASPLVAGLVGLLYSAPCPYIAKNAISSPAAQALLMKKYIMDAVDPVSNLKTLNVSGGRVNAFEALKTVATFCSSCVPPSLTNQSITKTSIKVGWSLPDSVLNVNVRWRELNAASWTTVSKQTLSYLLDNTKPCTDYEFQFQSNCPNNALSAWSKSYTIKSEGCCATPTLNITNVSKNGITMEWLANPNVPTATFDIQYKKTGATAFILIKNVTSPYVLSPVDSATSYDMQLRTNCTPTLTTAWSATKSAKTLSGAACIDLKYCKAATYSATFEYIKKVKFNTINNSTTGTTGGYASYTGGKKTQVTQGSSYDLAVTPGFLSAGSPSNVYVRAWIDYNQDGKFDPQDELVFDAGKTVTAIVTGSVDIPWFAKEGSTRLRVGLKTIFGTEPLVMSPCDTLSGYGEYEDYCIDIVNGFIPCAQVPNLKIAKIEPGIATIKWDTVSNIVAYNIRYREFGAMDWKEESTVGTQYQVKGLADCKKYEVQVRSVCKNDLSGYSPSIFPIYCKTSSNDIDNDAMAMNVYPVPFTNALFTEFSLQEQNNVKIEVFNTAGQIMTSQKMDNLNASRHKVRIYDIESWANGLYWVKISTANGSTTKKVIKMND
jgi:serine protease